MSVLEAASAPAAVTSVLSPSPTVPAVAEQTLQAIRYTPATDTQEATLEILNQRLLPHETVYIPINNSDDAFTAIREMYVRGAPAIAIVAALSLIIEFQDKWSLKWPDPATLDLEFDAFLDTGGDDLPQGKDEPKSMDELAKETGKALASLHADYEVLEDKYFPASAIAGLRFNTGAPSIGFSSDEDEFEGKNEEKYVNRWKKANKRENKKARSLPGELDRFLPETFEPQATETGDEDVFGIKDDDTIQHHDALPAGVVIEDEDVFEMKDIGMNLDGLDQTNSELQASRSPETFPDRIEILPDDMPNQMALLLESRLQRLLSSRPTAVNLGDAVRKLGIVVLDAMNKDGATGHDVKMAYTRTAERMLIDDVADNTAIGRYGARWIMYHCGKHNEKVSVLTHCNTGSLATAGYGTALGIVRSLYSTNQLERAYYTETRPYNQGSRLTGYELLYDGIPSTLVTDSMAAALMEKFRTEGNGLAAVVVGADRVAANGDTANKIGTYALAVLARFHGVKFLVAAPRTTIDLATPSGKEIVIEERPPNEMFTVRGPEVLGYSTETGFQSVDVEKIANISTAALGTQCWNPAFDVTPAALIDGIVTEVGVAEKDEHGKFDLQYLFSLKEVLQDLAAGEKDMPDPREGP